MTNKRYYKVEYNEEYYIFDSETITKDELSEKIEYDDYKALADSLTSDEILKMLNNYSEATVNTLFDCVKKGVELEYELQQFRNLADDYNINYNDLCDAFEDILDSDKAQLMKENKILRELIYYSQSNIIHEYSTHITRDMKELDNNINGDVETLKKIVHGEIIE